MHIIECNKPKQKKIFNFISDKPLSKQMNAIPLYNNLNRYSTSLFVGKQGSGKSSLVMEFLQDKQCLYQVFDHIFVFLPSTSKSNIDGDSPYNKIPENQIYEELDIQNLTHVYQQIYDISTKNNDLKNENKERCLLIFDDVSSEFKNAELQAIFKRFIKNQRHLLLSTIFIMQSFYDMPKQLRNICNNLFLFKMSKEVMYNIFDELIELPKKDYDKLLKMVFQNEHDFMLINFNSKQIFRNYDRIMFDD